MVSTAKIRFLAAFFVSTAMMLSACTSQATPDQGRDGSVTPEQRTEAQDISQPPMSKAEAADVYLQILCSSNDPLIAMTNLSLNKRLTQSDLPEINERVTEAIIALLAVADSLLSTERPWPRNLELLVEELALSEIARAEEIETLLNARSITDFEQRWESTVARLNSRAPSPSRDIRREVGLPDEGGCTPTPRTERLFLERARSVNDGFENVSDRVLLSEIRAWCSYISVKRNQTDVEEFIRQSAIPANSFVDFSVSGTDLMCRENRTNAIY